MVVNSSCYENDKFVCLITIETTRYIAVWLTNHTGRGFTNRIITHNPQMECYVNALLVQLTKHISSISHRRKTLAKKKMGGMCCFIASRSVDKLIDKLRILSSVLEQSNEP